MFYIRLWANGEQDIVTHIWLVQTLLECTMLQWCGFLMPTLTCFIINHMFGQAYLKKAFVFLLSKLPAPTDASYWKEGKKQLYGSLKQSETFFYGHTKHFPLHNLISRFHDCSLFPGANKVWNMVFSLMSDFPLIQRFLEYIYPKHQYNPSIQHDLLLEIKTIA